MKSVYIIGHRGAAGLALENTLDSIATTIKAGVDMIEFDVRKTLDDELVVCHDNSLQRTFGVDMNIAEHDLAVLQNACPKLPTLSQVITACGTTPMVIELKQVIDPELLLKTLKNTAKSQYSFVSFKTEALATLQAKFPGQPTSLLSLYHPCGRIRKARQLGAEGIGMHFLLINPFVYWRAQRQQLNVYVYTINSPLVARIIALLYPRTGICTNRPDRMQFLRAQ